MLPSYLVVGIAVDPKEDNAIHKLSVTPQSVQMELQGDWLIQQPIFIGIFPNSPSQGVSSLNEPQSAIVMK